MGFLAQLSQASASRVKEQSRHDAAQADSISVRLRPGDGTLNAGRRIYCGHKQKCLDLYP